MGERFPNKAPTSKIEIPGRPGWTLEASLLDAKTITVTVRRAFPGGAWEIARYTDEKGLVYSRDDQDKRLPALLCLRAYRKITDSGGVRWDEALMRESIGLGMWAEFIDDLPNILTAAEVIMV